MRQLLSILVVCTIVYQHGTWAFNYCQCCFSASITDSVNKTVATNGCCGERANKARKCAACCDRCKCNSLETDDRFDYPSADFEFSCQQEYQTMFMIPLVVSTKEKKHVYKLNHFSYCEPLPPPQKVLAIFTTDILLI